MADVKITLLPESFGPAAEKLAGTVQHVVEFIAGPERVRARAQAHADAEAYAIATKAEADARAKGLESRALVRLKKRETRRQNNIEQITEKAMLQLPPPEQVSDERVSEDWTSRFFEECQDINDEQMQQIWARILAGEVARPSSFSPRTLSIVRDMTRSDAAQFGTLCNFVWLVPSLGPVPLIFNSDAVHSIEIGLDFGVLLHLTSIGLIEFGAIAPFQIPSPPDVILPTYCGIVYSFSRASGSDNRSAFPLGHAMFTVVGKELFRICTQTRDEEHERDAIATWCRLGWNASR